MYSPWICLALFLISGIAVLTQAKITVRITSRSPKIKHVFKGDQIKLRCEANETQGRRVSITWHKNSYTDPAITNSSNVSNVRTWNEENALDNKTISVLTVNVVDRKNGELIFIYCVAKIGNENVHPKELFEFVPDSQIPNISVVIPQRQAVVQGTRRHNLHCEVSSNVKIDKLYITWLFGNQLIGETEIKEANKGKLNVLLQCIGEHDLGNYTCVANTSMYSNVWQDSGVMLLTGNFSRNDSNVGMTALPSKAYCIALSLILWIIT